MQLLDADNAEAWLRERGHLQTDDRVRIERLAGGVSNEVMYVAVENRPGGDFVLKQAREQLRVKDEWFSRVDRVWREVEVLRICHEVLAAHPPQPGEHAATTPEILFEDRDDYAFGMTAAPRQHTVWKQQLLDGQFDEDIARQCGRLLGRLHAGTWHHPDVRERLEDRAIFDELRIDPYYRTIAARHADLQPAVDALIESVWSQRHALVHADFSPKNLLVYDGGLLMVDFETGHYGDPAFDLGFFLTHVVLKSIYHAPTGSEACLRLTDEFFAAYQPQLAAVVAADEYAALVARGIRNLGGCLLARVDGKSPVDYLRDDAMRETVRRLARSLLLEDISDWPAVTARVRDLTGLAS